MTRIVAVNAGLGDPSSTRLLVDRLVDAVTAELADGQVEVTVLDLRDLAEDIARSMTAGFGVGATADALTAVHEADGIIAATPVFNASYSGLFKSFFDLVDVDAFTGTPVLIGATGGSPRHSMVLDHAMRPMFGYLRSVVTPTGVYAASEDWAGTSGDTATLADRIRRAAAEFARLLPGESSRSNESTQSSDASSGSTSTEQRRGRAEADGIANFARLLGNG